MSLTHLIGNTIREAIQKACTAQHPQTASACRQHVEEKFAEVVDRYCTANAGEVGLSPINCKQMMLDPTTANAQIKTLIGRHPVKGL